MEDLPHMAYRRIQHFTRMKNISGSWFATCTQGDDADADVWLSCQSIAFASSTQLSQPAKIAEPQPQRPPRDSLVLLKS
ncbi:hypothetical protein GQ457_06G027570 [Hibiscus cannabinus]